MQVAVIPASEKAKSSKMSGSDVLSSVLSLSSATASQYESDQQLLCFFG